MKRKSSIVTFNIPFVGGSPDRRDCRCDVPGGARADEGGISFWLPGQFGSLAAAPGVPGWAVGIVNYYTSVSGNGAVAASREVTLGKFTGNVTVNLNATIKATPDLVFIAPSYTFATPVFGGQLAPRYYRGCRAKRRWAGRHADFTGPGGGVFNRQGGIDDGRNGLAMSTHWRH